MELVRSMLGARATCEGAHGACEHHAECPSSMWSLTAAFEAVTKADAALGSACSRCILSQGSHSTDSSPCAPCTAMCCTLSTSDSAKSPNKKHKVQQCTLVSVAVPYSSVPQMKTVLKPRARQ